MYFRKYRLQKRYLDKCLKSRFSDKPLTDNKANGSKDGCNVNGSTFTMIINHCEGNYVGKSLFW